MKKPGKIIYKIIYAKDVAKYDIPALPKKIGETIRRAIEDRLTSDPIRFGEPLKFTLKGWRRLRIGKYRVIYCINEESKEIFIKAIDHRKDIYDV